MDNFTNIELMQGSPFFSSMLYRTIRFNSLSKLLRANTRKGRRLFSAGGGRNTVPLTYEPLANNALNEDSLRNIVVQSMKGYDGSLINSSNIHFSVVTGGITNKLYKCTLDGHSKGSVLVRIFGGEGMIDRDIETETFIALSDQGVGAEFIAVFENGRVEGWIDNASPPCFRLRSDKDKSAINPK